MQKAGKLWSDMLKTQLPMLKSRFNELKAIKTQLPTLH